MGFEKEIGYGQLSFSLLGGEGGEEACALLSDSAGTGPKREGWVCLGTG